MKLTTLSLHYWLKSEKSAICRRSSIELFASMAKIEVFRNFFERNGQFTHIIYHTIFFLFLARSMHSKKNSKYSEIFHTNIMPPDICSEKKYVIFFFYFDFLLKHGGDYYPLFEIERGKMGDNHPTISQSKHKK